MAEISRLFFAGYRSPRLNRRSSDATSITFYRSQIDRYQTPGRVIAHTVVNFILEIDAVQKIRDIIRQDTRYQTLFRLLDQIREVLFDSKILAWRNLYAKHHFSLDETSMPILDRLPPTDHVETYNSFVEELTSIRETHSEFLYRWLKLRVLDIDKQLVHLVLKSTSR